MGAQNSVIKEHKPVIPKITNEIVKFRNTYYKIEYNWVPSFTGANWAIWNKVLIDRKFNTSDPLPTYVDLRNQFPLIRTMHPFPINPILSVIYILEYQLVKNGLPVFPPSALYIYKNMFYYPGVHSIMSFETIFNSILNNGICSENDYGTTQKNLEDPTPFSNKLVEKARAFQFIEINRVEQSEEIIKTLLKNKIPVLCGLIVYYDLKQIDTHMWKPDHTMDQKKGGIAGVIVGYIDERKLFIMSTTYGTTFGMSGFVFVPYEYILDPEYTMELYTINFNRDRVEGYINQHKDMVVLQNNKKEMKENQKKYKKDELGGIFK
jgi:hypothetical protein